MLQVDVMEWRWRWALHPLVRAFALSVALHLTLFSTLEIGNRLDLWRFSPLVLLAKALHLNQPQPKAQDADPSRTKPTPEEEALEVPLYYVDVAPSQATADPPKETPYYSDVNSRAANPDTSLDTRTPKIDGQQERLLRTRDTAKPGSAPAPLQPAPPEAVISQAPPESPPPTPPPSKPEPAPPPKPAQAKAEPPPSSKPEPAPSNPAPRPPVPPGDLAMAAPARPEPVVLVESPPARPEAPPPRTRPRTVATAKALQGEPAGGLVGEKMKQEGGVKRFSVEASLDVKASPFGNYDRRFIEAVQNCWYALLEEQRYSLDRLGKVVLDFRLTYDGRITDLKLVASDVGGIYTALCQLAITKPAPYERWPPEMRKAIGANSRDVRFTFFY